MTYQNRSYHNLRVAYRDSQDAFSGASIFGLNPSVAYVVDTMFRRAGLETTMATAHIDGGYSVIILSAKYNVRPLSEEELESVSLNIQRRVNALGFRNITITAEHFSPLNNARFYLRQRNVTL